MPETSRYDFIYECLDFIINYDIKHETGRGAEEGETVIEIPVYRPLSWLVDKYFGKYLDQLTDAVRRGGYPKPYFVKYAFSPFGLEERLARIESLGLTAQIISEVGQIQEASELDRRLTDAWAELKVVDQLQSEGFQDIRKVTETADFTAQCGAVQWAFQVIRINKDLPSLISRESVSMAQNSESFYHDTYGPLTDIYSTEHGWLRSNSPVANFFWDAIRVKNSKFSKYANGKYRRCIVIVTIESWFGTDFEQQLGAYLIRNAIHDEGLGRIEFEDLLWLPNLGDGLWFTVDSTSSETRCFGTPDTLPNSDYEAHLRQNHFRLEIKLNIDPAKETILFGGEWWRVCQ